MNKLPKKAKFAVIKQFGGPEVFQIIEQNLPEIKPNQVLIKVHAASLNPIDRKQRNGNHKLILGSPFPITLGYDVSGTVVKTGSEIINLSEGDEVFGVLDNKYGGAYGQYAKGTEKCFIKRPESIDKISAAAIPMAALTALQALKDKGNLEQGQSVIINGASGGVGHIAIQVAKLMKANTIAVASGRNESFIRDFNPDEFWDYTKHNILDYDKKVDLFLDVAGTLSFIKTKHLLHKNGIYLNLNYLDSIKKSPFNKISQIFSKGKKAKTMLMKQSPEDLEKITNWIIDQKLKVYINNVFDLNEITNAHKTAEKGNKKGKNILKINQ